MSDYLFTRDGATGKALVDWWKDLENNKGDRAELRRCQNVGEIVLTPAYQFIYRRLVQVGLPDDEQWREHDFRVPTVIGVVAHIKHDFLDSERDSFPKQLSKTEKGSDRPPFSPNRFRALLQQNSADDLYTSLRRALPLIDNTADICQLASNIYYWGEKVQRRWAYAYNWPARNAG